LSGGRRAALPPSAYRSPARCDEHSDNPFRVTVFPEHGHYSIVFDFAVLPVPDLMRRWLRDRFVVATAAGGSHRTEQSVRSLMRAVRSFAAYLGTVDRPPEEPSRLRGSHWDGWVLTVPMASRKSMCGGIRTLIKGCPGLPAEFLSRAQRNRGSSSSASKLPAYSPEEFSRITNLAKSDVRDAIRRVRRGRELLESWRAGEVDRAADARRWEHGFLLDHIERHAEIPKYPCGRSHQKVRKHGGSAALFSQLFPTVFFGGPHAPQGQPCTASFLMCLSCSCSRATPAHLPTIVDVHDRLRAKAKEMTPLRWAKRFAGPVAQLEDIMSRYPTAVVQDARVQVGSAQKQLVERFLSRSLDV
jgi:hypothetical protein